MGFDVAGEIDHAQGGVAGLFQVQDALKRYLSRPDGPVELRLNGVYMNCENDVCVALFDTADAARAYFAAALLPKHLRYTSEGDGRFRSFRSDSICYDFNPHGGDTITEGERILAAALPWNVYNSQNRPFERPVFMNPVPPTGPPPPTPAGARVAQVSAS